MSRPTYRSWPSVWTLKEPWWPTGFAVNGPFALQFERVPAYRAFCERRGRRESAICSLRASDLLLTEGRIREALAPEGMDERTLFPSPRDESKPIRRETAARWLLRAEKLAKVPKLTGGTFHPFRRLFASERRHLPDLDVAAAAGWKNPQTIGALHENGFQVGSDALPAVAPCCIWLPHRGLRYRPGGAGLPLAAPDCAPRWQNVGTQRWQTVTVPLSPTASPTPILPPPLSVPIRLSDVVMFKCDER